MNDELNFQIGNLDDKFIPKVKKFIVNLKVTYYIDYIGNKFYKNKEGQYHREDGPAVERASGTKIWYINDERHRLDGPAMEYANGNKYWYKNNELHREDGPAIELVNGEKQYWIEGVKQ